MSEITFILLKKSRGLLTMSRLEIKFWSQGSIGIFPNSDDQTPLLSSHSVVRRAYSSKFAVDGACTLDGDPGDEFKPGSSLFTRCRAELVLEPSSEIRIVGAFDARNSWSWVMFRISPLTKESSLDLVICLAFPFHWVSCNGVADCIPSSKGSRVSLFGLIGLCLVPYNWPGIYNDGGCLFAIPR